MPTAAPDGPIATPVKVLLVDDEPIIRRAIRRLLALDFAGLDLTEAETVAGALAAVEARSFDVVLLDIGLPDGSGIDAIGPILARRPGVAILVVSSQPESQYADVCRDAGAADFVRKDQVPENLAAAIRRALGL